MRIDRNPLTAATALLCALAGAAAAQETREVGAHEHGVSSLQVAQDGNRVQIDLLSPGMDIVGFEYTPASDEDHAAVEAAILAMATVGNVLSLPEAAGCRLAEVLIHLHGADHDHADEAHDEMEGEDHDHEGEDHADGEDHDHESEEQAEGEDHDHEGAEHSEFHASYGFECADPAALTTIGLPFFDQFPNAQEVEAEFATDAATGAAEVARGGELTLN